MHPDHEIFMARIVCHCWSGKISLQFEISDFHLLVL